MSVEGKREDEEAHNDTIASPQLCYDILCPPFQYEPQKDVFNAAQSGAMIPNLVTHEFDYLYTQLTSVR